MTGREELRATFNSAAGIYQQARPGYPDEVYAELIRLTGLQPGARLLEVGCATGKATLPLARRGHPITCLEIGADLAAQARRNLAAFGGVEVIEAAFETWQPATEAGFDLVYAATAWHWIDPAVRYRRAWELLRPGGHLALWNALHVSPAGGDSFFDDIQEVYDEIGEACRRARYGSGRARCPTTGPRSRPAACSRTSWPGSSTGRSGTPRRSTSGCSTRSPAISR